MLGTDHVDAQLGDGLPAEAVLGLPRATINQACTPGGTVILLGPDPKDREGVPRLLTNESFSKLAEADPELQMRWSDGIEVLMDSKGFAEANIDLLQVRAVPKKLN